jgi:hypothetical protein
MSRKLDVRWPEELFERAEAVATGAGVRPSAVIRRAAELGMDAAAREFAGRPSKMGGAGAGGSPSVTAGTDASPRPSVPASARVRLDVAVAQMMEGGFGGGSRGPAPISLARAKRRVLDGQIKVAGEVEKDPAALVAPAEVGFLK